MRPHGRVRISRSDPRARAVCDRCYMEYNHVDLRWQYQWVGPKLQNLYLLVCERCLDVPQEQLRTIVLPPDPVPINYARPQNPISDNNAMSPIGASPNFLMQQYGSRIGNLTGGGGINAAFDGNTNKPAFMCSANSISNSSYNNYVGINWTGNTANLTMPSSLMPPVIRHSITSFTLTAPNDRSFLGNTPTDYVIQGSPTDTALYGAWTTIASGTTAGTVGEEITGQCVGGQYQFHRVAFLGDQTNYVAVAQLSLNVAQIGTIATMGAS